MKVCVCVCVCVCEGRWVVGMGGLARSPRRVELPALMEVETRDASPLVGAAHGE